MEGLDVIEGNFPCFRKQFIIKTVRTRFDCGRPSRCKAASLRRLVSMIFSSRIGDITMDTLILTGIKPAVVELALHGHQI